MVSKATSSNRRLEVMNRWDVKVIELVGASGGCRSLWYWDLGCVCLPLVEGIAAAMPPGWRGLLQESIRFRVLDAN